MHLTSCAILGNIGKTFFGSAYGAGIRIDNGEVYLTSCTISHNSVNGNGVGGMDIASGAEASVVNCYFS